MFEYSCRLQSELQNRNVLSRRCRALSIVVSLLSLLPENDQFLTLPASLVCFDSLVNWSIYRKVRCLFKNKRFKVKISEFIIFFPGLKHFIKEKDKNTTKQIEETDEQKNAEHKTGKNALILWTLNDISKVSCEIF